MDYPGLYDFSDEKSSKYQVCFFRLLLVEYLLLLLVSVVGLLKKDHIIEVTYAVIFCMLLIIMLYRNHIKHEQKWYKYRALAESIKTISWRYCMKTPPFNSEEKESVDKFIATVGELVNDNNYISDEIDEKYAKKDKITIDMHMLRTLSYDERKQYYYDNRIVEQREWYLRKATYNKKISRRWTYLIGSIYGISVIIVMLNAMNIEGIPDFPVDPVTTLAASIIGWAQIKKYNELAVSYFLTAHEIGDIKEQFNYVTSEVDFLEFVNDAEKAFSREHTQWLARR
ncbi:TPA: DUF4231 domain-containing protein [Salmonella enterica subsp. salamae serovar 52:z:z39]|nr:DUF4231 domain-containing protein [Salmonella enterica subsp. salamae serovar 52:z:z39]